MTGRVFFYAQHLLGVGHLKRAAAIAEAMRAAGLEVWVALGGTDPEPFAFPGCARVRLPPAHVADATFSALLDENGHVVDDEWRDKRMARLVTEFQAVEPDVLLIELFPFGRRMFRFELLPLLAEARAQSRRPWIVCSLRDVLVRKRDPARRGETVALAKEFFDRVLVHGDPRLIPLDATFPEAAALDDLITYTGYVVPTIETTEDPTAGQGEVIVSAGGGVVGEPLFRAALAARPLSRASDLPWRLVTGLNLPPDARAALHMAAPAGVTVDGWRGDLATRLGKCVLSVSQGGYNTLMDILRARTRAVVVPFGNSDENEQEFRTRILAERGFLSMIPPDHLSPNVLARAIDERLEISPTAPAGIDFDGSETTARIIAGLCGQPPVGRV